MMGRLKTSHEYNQQLFEREIDYWPIEPIQWVHE